MLAPDRPRPPAPSDIVTAWALSLARTPGFPHPSMGRNPGPAVGTARRAASPSSHQRSRWGRGQRDVAGRQMAFGRVSMARFRRCRRDLCAIFHGRVGGRPERGEAARVRSSRSKPRGGAASPLLDAIRVSWVQRAFTQGPTRCRSSDRRPRVLSGDRALVAVHSARGNRMGRRSRTYFYFVAPESERPRGGTKENRTFNAESTDAASAARNPRPRVRRDPGRPGLIVNGTCR